MKEFNYSVQFNNSEKQESYSAYNSEFENNLRNSANLNCDNILFGNLSQLIGYRQRIAEQMINMRYPIPKEHEQLCELMDRVNFKIRQLLSL